MGSQKASQGQMRCDNWGIAPWEFRVPGRTPWGGWSQEGSKGRHREKIKLRLRAGQATRAPTAETGGRLPVKTKTVPPFPEPHTNKH